MPLHRPQTVQLPRLEWARAHQGSHEVKLHTHPLVELVYVVQGELIIHAGAHDLRGKPGTIFVLPGNVPHDQLCDGPWRTLCVLYRHGAHLLDETPRTLDLAAAPHLGAWLEDLCKHSAAPEAEAMLDGLLFAVLSALRKAERAAQSAEALHPRLADAVRYLQQHLTEAVDAGDLSRAAHLSYSHLSALFRERFGCGPLKYQQNLRLEHARRQLLDPYLSIDEVARDCGYDDTNYFVRLFRRAQGVPPGRWRKQASGRAS